MGLLELVRAMLSSSTERASQPVLLGMLREKLGCYKRSSYSKFAFFLFFFFNYGVYFQPDSFPDPGMHRKGQEKMPRGNKRWDHLFHR